MIVQLITAFGLSALVLIMTWAVFRTIKRPMPRSLLPIMLAGTVIGYGIYSEYTWASRTLAEMPPSYKVVHRLSGRSVFSPWSYIIPRTDRLSVVDTASIMTNEQYPAYAIVELFLLQRFSPVIQVRQMLDCVGSRRTDLTNETTFDDQGLPVNLQWESLPKEHALLTAACGSNV